MDYHKRQHSSSTADCTGAHSPNPKSCVVPCAGAPSPNPKCDVDLDWRTTLLSHFVPGISRKTVVADPDELFRDDKVFRTLTDRGFKLLYFEDPIAFRFTYESQFRAAWDRGETTELVVIVRPDTCELEKLPADILQDARPLSFYLKDVFPNLSYTVVSKLDRSYFDALYRAHKQYAKQPFGEALTREFILKHVFETVPELLKKDSDLLRSLLQRHYRKQQIPLALDEYFLSVLAKSGRFNDWPLKAITLDRNAFWDFLQERWGLFIHKLSGGTQDIAAAAEPVALKYSGVYALPFEHDDVRVYIDNLFNEGILKPISWVAAAVKTMPWVGVGMQGGTGAQQELRFEDLCKGVTEKAPAKDASAYDWLAFAHQYAQMQRVWNENTQTLRSAHGGRYASLRQQLNKDFSAWVSTAYQGLYNHPAVHPVMVHHIPAYLASRLAQKEARKVAFLLLDGLALDQWLLLKDALAPALTDVTLRENALMAWIPTITPVSRQAAFAGKIPLYFTETVFRTDKDEYGWRQFWSDRGMQLDQVAFSTVRGDNSDLSKLESAFEDRVRVFGCTIYKVDEISHGVKVGAAGMTSQVKTWAADGFLGALVQRLLKEDFTVFLSADHGNVEAVGVGSLKEGALSETKGERCRIFSDVTLRASVQAKFPDTIVWDHQGLPNNFHCLLAPPDKAFVPQGQTAICHGGISLDEVIVPFIEISHRKAVY